MTPRPTVMRVANAVVAGRITAAEGADVLCGFREGPDPARLRELVERAVRATVDAERRSTPVR